MINASSLPGSSAWFGSFGSVTSSSHWLSTEWLASRKAIPLYLLLGLWLVQRLPSLLERLFTPKATSSTSAYVVPAETRHARFLPVQSQHAFRYNTLYLALRLDQLETRKLDTGHAFAWKGPVLEPEFVDETALADRRGVTPAGHAKVAGGEKEEWKARMRAAERIERRRLEEKRNRNDRYTWSLTGLHPSGYLRTHIPTSVTKDTCDEKQDASTNAMSDAKEKWISGSVLLKLAYELRQQGFLSVGPQDSDGSRSDVTEAGVPTWRDWRDELGHVWTVTMPSIAGITGINPLTVHYCYRPYGYGKAPLDPPARKTREHKRGPFWLVVLEVHNTFSERHIYVLEAGKNEDGLDGGEGRRGGYEHQWTFPRSFHVSPFNDRGGYYRLFLKEPFAQEGAGFTFGVRLLLLVEAEDAPADQPPKLVKKLMATLDSVSPRTCSKSSKPYVGRCVRPLSPATLYAALLRQPVDLLLTFFRILWQARKLHFAKRLDAFGRPDMVQVSEPQPPSFDGVGLPPPVNRIQPHRSSASAPKEQDASVGLVYPEPGWVETVAKAYVEDLLTRRVEELEKKNKEAWSVVIESTDPADAGLRIVSNSEGTARKLVLYTRSYGVYADLMTYRPARLALLLGSMVGRRWGVSSRDAFDDFFPAEPVSARGARKRMFDFQLISHLRASRSQDRTKVLELLQTIGISTSANATSGETNAADGWRVTVALWLGYAAAVAEKKAFAVLGARYVKGTEAWLELSRGLEYVEAQQQKERNDDEVDKARWDTKLGSVYHP